VSDYTHRDRRAHRDVGRGFWAVVGISVGLTGIAIVVPISYVGLAVVVALGVLGAAYVGYSDRLLASYGSDLRQVRDGSVSDGFLRAEVGSPVGLDRDGTSPMSLSPHARGRPSASRENDPEPTRPAAGSDSDQA